MTKHAGPLKPNRPTTAYGWRQEALLTLAAASAWFSLYWLIDAHWLDEGTLLIAIIVIVPIVTLAARDYDRWRLIVRDTLTKWIAAPPQNDMPEYPRPTSAPRQDSAKQPGNDP